MTHEEAADRATWQPEILDLQHPAHARRFASLSQRAWQLHDSLNQQLSDLVATRVPQHVLTPELRQQMVQALLGDTQCREYGRWIYYPWSGRLVHTLPPDQFAELRLDRNRNKITRSEQQRLNCWGMVGIIGLSVGNAVALSLAQEGVCRHLRLADFDRLDLSNTNRLRARIDELGLSKTVIAARQIYELNPFASISLFQDGVSAANLDEFFACGGPLDVLVDECDSLQLKFSMRERARAARIPVVMATSDRGCIDVERFDLESHRPLFHGLVGALSAAELGEVSRAERVAVVLRILDPNQLSARAAASLVEVDETLSTWPQLASEVAIGAAALTAAIRRLGLGQALPSGRTLIDLDEMLGHERLVAARPATRHVAEPVAANGSGSEFMQFLVQHAVLAPSPGNSQPWRFSFDGSTLWLSMDRQRSAAMLDPRRYAALLALGAAIQNITIAAASRNVRVEVSAFPNPADVETVAALRFRPDGSADHKRLAAALPLVRQRVTNRRRGERRPLGAEAVEALRLAAEQYGAHLELRAEAAVLHELGEVLAEADRIRALCAPLHDDMFAELRWTEAEALETRDGLDVTTLELDASRLAALQLLRRQDVAALLCAQNGGRAIGDLARESIAGASGVGLLTLGSDTPGAWLEGGRAMQAVWLRAAELGLAYQPMTAVLYMLELLKMEPTVFVESHGASLASLRGRLSALFSRFDSDCPAMLFRLTTAADPSARSLRIPFESLLSVTPGVPDTI